MHRIISILLVVLFCFAARVQAETFVLPGQVVVEMFSTLPISYYGNPEGNFCGVLLFTNWECEFCRDFAARIMDAIDSGERIVLYLYIEPEEKDEALEKIASFICSKKTIDDFISGVEVTPHDGSCEKEVKKKLIEISNWFDDRVLDVYFGSDFELSYPAVLVNDGRLYMGDTLIPEVILEHCREVVR